MKNIIIFLCLCTICMCRLHAADSSRADSLLLKLDQAIKERPIYMEQKELKLVELKRLLHRQIPDEERFAILGTLLDEYRSFNTDSALHMAEEREQIAIRLGNREYIDNARMNKADVLGMTGMYKEVMDFMRKYGSRKQEMVQNSYLTDTQWVLLVSSLGCIIENGQKMERKGGSSVTKSFDKR